MTTADTFDALQGDPVFQVTFQAFAEALDGNGILTAGALDVTAGTDPNALDVAAATTGLWYNGSLHTYGGATNVITLSSNSSGDDRWDLIYFDTSDDTPKAREGTPAAKPDLPSLQADEFPLAAVYVADGESDVTDSEIKSYRTHGSEAVETYLDDSAGEFSADDVENALTEVIREAGDPLNGSLDLSSFSGTPVLDLGTNPGAFGEIVDAVVDSNSTAGTAHSFKFAIDGTALLRFYAESDGSGGLQNVDLRVLQTLAVGGDIETTGGTTLFDASAGEFPRAVLDDERVVSATKTAAYTTSGEEVIPVDPSGGAVTITIASADISEGNFITIVDVTGNAGTNTITVDTEGGETIDGSASVTIETDHGATVVFSPDGSNLNTAGGGGGGGGGIDVEDDQTTVTSDATALSAGAGFSATDDGDGTATFDYEHAEVFEGRESGTVSDTNQGILVIDHLADGETVEVYKAALTLADGQAAPTSLDLELVTLDNAGGFTSQATLISGDGSTVFDDETGSPLGTYTNSSGSGETIAVLVDNGTGSSQDVMAVVEGLTGE